MPRFTTSVLIRRSPEEVYAYMDDVSREKEWQPNLRSAHKEPAGPTRPGTRKRYVSDFLGRQVENTYRILELDPGRRVVQETTPGSSAKVRSETRWEEVPEGTRVTLTVNATPSGLMRLLPSGVLEAATRKEMNESLDLLRRVLERG
jgi:carbon monoxide dehydrogenase subunit G